MKKPLLALMLALAGIQGTVCAQDSSYAWEARKMNDKTYATFNMNQFEVKHRHTVYLQQGNKMIVELSRLSDYEQLKDLGKILVNLRDNISFYKDSLGPDYSGNVRIDYTLSPFANYNKMRFKKYDPSGDMYLAKNGELSKLKLDQDTISLKIYSGDDMQTWDWGVERYTNMRVTFVLNNYTDIDQLIAKKDSLQHFIDTMATVSLAHMKEHYQKNGDIYLKTTIVYRPYWVVPERFAELLKGKNINLRFHMYDFDASQDNGYGIPFDFSKYHDGLKINIKIGAGLVRNRISPSLDVGPEYRDYWEKGKKQYSVFGLNVSPYFFFDKKADGNFHTYTTWFVNAEIGESDDAGFLDKNFQRATMGVGYLINPDGVYFKRITAKAFFNLTFPRGITFSPELIFTNNFGQIFPGMSVKMLF